MTTVEQLIREAAGLNAGVVKVASKKADKNEAKKISEGLMKIAALPYKEEVHNSIKEIMKLASGSIDTLISDIVEKDEKINHLTKIAEIRGIVDSMLDKNLIEKNEIQEKTAELLKKSEHEIEIVKEAIALGSISSKNIFFETEKTASVSYIKRGMFDGVEGL
jgi:hypothetical protein